MIKLGLFDNAVEVVINNKVVQSIKTPLNGVIYEKGNGTFLTIDVPLNIVYSDAFNISGVLKDSNHTGLSGETVKLKVGNTVVDTTTTTTNGAYSFTQTPVATGNHSFQVIYEGSLDYNASQSSIVNRVIGKETTVLSVTSPTDNYTTYDTQITFTGTLTDDDGTPLANKNIVVSDNNDTYDTLQTDSNGAFTGTITFTTGSYALSISYAGDSNYTASTVNRNLLIREHDYAISISADKTILSYADEESATITALLTDNSVALTDETLTYTVKHGATVIDTGSDTTDSNGMISFEYESTGIGDVEIIIDFGILLQETYEVLDAKKYIPNSQIIGERFNNDRYMYISDYQVSVGETVYFKFNTVPNKTVVGIADLTNGNDVAFQKDGNTYTLYRGGYSNSPFPSRWSNGTVFSLEIYTENGVVRIREYQDGEYKSWWNTQWKSRHIRVDRFDNNLVDLDIIVL